MIYLRTCYQEVSDIVSTSFLNVPSQIPLPPDTSCLWGEKRYRPDCMPLGHYWFPLPLVDSAVVAAPVMESVCCPFPLLLTNPNDIALRNKVFPHVWHVKGIKGIMLPPRVISPPINSRDSIIKLFTFHRLFLHTGQFISPYCESLPISSLTCSCVSFI